MAMFQGSPLENITTVKSTQDTVPQYVTDYQQDIINLGKNAVQQGGVANLSPLTQQAMNMAPQVEIVAVGHSRRLPWVDQQRDPLRGLRILARSQPHPSLCTDSLAGLASLFASHPFEDSPFLLGQCQSQLCARELLVACTRQVCRRLSLCP